MSLTINWNELDRKGGALSDNNLTFSYITTPPNSIRSNISRKDNGKYYAEFKMTSPTGAGSQMIGLSNSNWNMNASLARNFLGASGAGNNTVAYWDNGYVSRSDVYFTTSAPKMQNGDVISILLNLTDNYVEFKKNNVFVYKIDNIKTLIGNDIYISLSLFSGNCLANFGDSEFVYQVPDGYNPYNYEQKKLLLIESDNVYYYNNSVDWISLGSNPTVEEILQHGMSNITKQQIYDFEILKGLNWNPVQWTDGISYSDATLYATPIPQTLTAKSSIQLTGVVGGSFKWTATGESRVALSVDDGVTYHAFKNGIWNDVTNDMSNAMTAEEYTAMTWEQYKLLAGDSNFLKHQYYIPDNSTVDDILITCELMGTNRIAPSSSFDLNYEQNTKTIRYNIKSSGTFFVSYVDITNTF